MKIVKKAKKEKLAPPYILKEDFDDIDNQLLEEDPETIVEAALYTESSEAALPELTGSNIAALFNSKEFKTPISEEEAESYLADTSTETTIESLEELDEASVTTCIKDYLTEAYSNVRDFKVSNCKIKNKQLFIEGKVTFNSGKVKRTAFEFGSYSKNLLEGKNAGIADNLRFSLAYKQKNNKLLAESLKYSVISKD